MRTILISGANRGIGQKIAHKELKEGNRISVGIRDLESLKGSAWSPKLARRENYNQPLWCFKKNYSWKLDKKYPR